MCDLIFLVFVLFVCSFVFRIIARLFPIDTKPIKTRISWETLVTTARGLRTAIRETAMETELVTYAMTMLMETVGLLREWGLIVRVNGPRV